MPLILQLVNETTLPDGGPVSFQLSGKCVIDIGRAAHLDWTLPDPTKFISNKHCEIRYKDGGYWLHDVSTNGTFLNGADHRMQAPHRLRNGDRFTVGHYLVAVTLEGTEEAADETRGAAVPPPAHVPDDQDLWADEGDVLPAIDPKQLRRARQNAPVDWSADIPDPFRVPVADLPAQPGRDPASSSALDDIDWAGPPRLPQPPPPAGVEQSSIGPVVFALRGGASAAHQVAHAPQKGPARLISLPALMTPASTPPPLGVQPRTLCRRESSASLTKTSDGILATKAWMAPRIEVLGLGRIIPRWIISAFGAAFLLTAVWLMAFFLTSSENRSPVTTRMTAAVPILLAQIKAASLTKARWQTHPNRNPPQTIFRPALPTLCPTSRGLHRLSALLRSGPNDASLRWRSASPRRGNRRSDRPPNWPIERPTRGRQPRRPDCRSSRATRQHTGG